MITVTGKLEDATGAALHAQIDFVSKSTPLVGSGGVVTTNTDDSIKSNPSDGTFSVTLAPGNYAVTITANGQSTPFTVAVPAGTATVSIDTLVTSPLVYPFVAPNTLWDGTAQNITFEPMANPPAPTANLVAYTGGNIAAVVGYFAYFVSYVTATGETALSPVCNVHISATASNMAAQIALVPNVSGVTAVHLWRTYVGRLTAYSSALLPLNVGLLATVDPGASYYNDWESNANFAGRVNTAIIPPLFNTTAGQLLSSSGNPAVYINDTGLFIPGANCRFKPGTGLQIYNFTTQLWHTVLCVGSPAELALDAGNPN